MLGYLVKAHVGLVSAVHIVCLLVRVMEYCSFSTRGCHACQSPVSHVQYEDGEEVVLWMNTVGPYHNRQETYTFFSLPFCRGPQHEIGHYHETLGEALQGVELEFSGLEMGFKGMAWGQS